MQLQELKPGSDPKSEVFKKRKVGVSEGAPPPQPGRRYVSPSFSALLRSHLKQKPLAGNDVACLFVGAVGSL